MHSDFDFVSCLEPLMDEGWISEILYEVKSGKEATVFCCKGGTCSPVPLVAAKVFRPIETRRFRNESMYLEGRLHMVRNGRARRAVMSNSAFGKEVQYGTWLYQEWETLNALYDSGADVPEPLKVGDHAILMPFLGDEHNSAPMLHELRPDMETTAVIIDHILRNVELMLDCDCVHGDLSPFNVMYHENRALIIDFPQAIDPRLNRNAHTLLTRDVENICRWASKHGVERDTSRIVIDLWTRFVNGELG